MKKRIAWLNWHRVQLRFLIALCISSAVVARAPADAFIRISDPALDSDPGRFVSPSWGDYNNDGHIDVFVTADGGSSRLYENRGDGTFRLVEGQPAAGSGAVGHAAVWGDHDNDGDLDLLLTRWEKGSLGLFVNQGDGTFSEVTSGEIARQGNKSSGAAWADYDRDGLLDLHVSNYGAANWLFHGQGGGEFALVTGSPFNATGANSMGCAWADYDNDGIPDLFVGNSTRTAAYLFHGQAGGAFERITGRHPATLSSGYWLGGDWGDYDNDGDLDLYVTSGGQGDVLYRNEGDGTFALASGVVPSSGSDTVHPLWVDYDNDGWLDLYVTRAMTASLAGVLFRNRGDGGFEKIVDSVITTEIFPSAGCCWGDYDNDGFQDLFVAGGGFNTSHANVLYRNSGNANGWLKLKLVGTASTRSGIGAKVRVRATIGGRTLSQLREISGGTSSAGAQNGLIAHFGLGDAARAEAVRIEWPSGTVQELGAILPRQTLVVVEPPRIKTVTQLAGDQVRMEVTGWPGQSYRVDASNDLQTWTALGTASVEDGAIEISDKDGEAPHRFYCLAVPRTESLATFTPPNLPEGLTLDAQGNACVSMSQTGEVWKVAPDGTTSVLAALTGMPAGLTTDAAGAVYVNLIVLQPEPRPELHGVWRIAPDGTAARFAALPLDCFSNDVLFGPDGRLYVTDSAGGRVFVIESDGSAGEWLPSTPLLLGNPAPPPPQPYSIGANGMAFFGDNAYVCNTDLGTLVRIPVQTDGTSGTPEAFLDDPRLYGADGLKIDAYGNLYVANVMQSFLLRVTPEKHVDTLATTRDGLDSPSSLCFGSTDPSRLYFVNYAAIQAMMPGGRPRPSLMRMEVGLPGQSTP